MTSDEEDEEARGGGDSDEDGDCQGGDSLLTHLNPRVTPVLFFNRRRLVIKRVRERRGYSWRITIRSKE